MKKLLTSLTASAATGAAFLTFALPTFATGGGNVNPCDGIQAGFDALCNLNSDNLGPIIGAVVTFLLIIIAIIALFFLIYGGLRWVTSGGDKGKVDEARKTVIAAIVGLVIAFLAFFILQVVLGFFGLSLTNLTLPTLPV
jgi:uncharacterized protein YacL